MANEDVELGGKTIKKSDRVRWFMTSANRDPEMFPDPDTFNINRYPNLHVASGAGIH
ncbi:MAG TPA: cytochrome P450, partial [Dehalococcoidia bacterium]|nr:cytochrome P450 [Dehalococcoidia bacterium]